MAYTSPYVAQMNIKEGAACILLMSSIAVTATISSACTAIHLNCNTPAAPLFTGFSVAISVVAAQCRAESIAVGSNDAEDDDNDDDDAQYNNGNQCWREGCWGHWHCLC